MRRYLIPRLSSNVDIHSEIDSLKNIITRCFKNELNFPSTHYPSVTLLEHRELPRFDIATFWVTIEPVRSEYQRYTPKTFLDRVLYIAVPDSTGERLRKINDIIILELSVKHPEVTVISSPDALFHFDGIDIKIPHN